MKLFKPLFYFTLVWSIFKIFVSIYGIIDPYEAGNFIVKRTGVESLVDSESVGVNMGKNALFAIIINLITSVLIIFAVVLMNQKKRQGFYLYCFSSAVVAITAFYSGINMFPSLSYIAVLPFIGIVAYTMALEYFWDKPVK